jgi:hypothetical protein
VYHFTDILSVFQVLAGMITLAMSSFWFGQAFSKPMTIPVGISETAPVTPTPPLAPTPPVAPTPPMESKPVAYPSAGPAAGPSRGPVVPNDPAPPGKWVYHAEPTSQEKMVGICALAAFAVILIVIPGAEWFWLWHMKHFRSAVWNKRKDKQIAEHQVQIAKLEEQKVTI